MPMYTVKGIKYGEIHYHKRQCKRAIVCKACEYMQQGWCNKYKTWCNDAYGCATRYPNRR